MGWEAFYCSCGQDFDERKLLEIHQQNCPTFQEFEEIDGQENKPPNQFKYFKWIDLNPNEVTIQCTNPDDHRMESNSTYLAFTVCFAKIEMLTTQPLLKNDQYFFISNSIFVKRP